MQYALTIKMCIHIQNTISLSNRLVRYETLTFEIFVVVQRSLSMNTEMHYGPYHTKLYIAKNIFDTQYSGNR